MTHPSNAYLAGAIAASQPSDNTLRIGSVVSLDGTTLKVLVNGGTIDAGWLSTFAPQVGQTVAIMRESAGWLVIGPTQGPATPPDAPVSSGGGGIVGEAYFSGGTTALAAGGLENIMTAWTSGGNFTFEQGQLYRWNLAFGFYDSAGTAHLCDIRLRKGFSTGGLQLAQFRRVTVAGVGASIVQMGYHSGFIKNASGGQVVTPIGVSIQRGAGTSNVALYGDATFQMVLTLEQVGAVGSYPTLAAIAPEIN